MSISLYPNSYQIAPMRYHNKLSESIVNAAMTNGQWIMQEKYDGSWYQLEKTIDGEVFLFGRTLSKKTGEYTEKIKNVPWLERWAKDSSVPPGTVLIGEIYIPGKHSNDVTKIMGCLPEKAIVRQEELIEKVQYRIFDCIYYNDSELTSIGFSNRFNIAKSIVESNSSCPQVVVAKTFVTNSDLKDLGILCENFSEPLQELFNKGGEGAVFKHVDGVYCPDSRPTTYFKIKEHVDSLDLVCSELLEAEEVYTGKELENWPYWAKKDSQTGEVYKYDLNTMSVNLSEDFYPITKHFYYGWKNGLRLSAFNKDGECINVGRVASGLSDANRKEMTLNPEKYLGKVVEVSCMSVNKKDKTLRHPVFIRVRDDKNPSECLVEEIFE